MFQIAEFEMPSYRNTYPVYPSMADGALPETFPEVSKNMATDTMRSTFKLFPKFWGYVLATYSNTNQLCKVTTGYIQLTEYSKHWKTSAKMICSVIGDSTKRLEHHDDYGDFGARKQFSLGLSRQLQKWGHQSTPPSTGQHNRLIINFKPTLDCSSSWRLTFLPFPLSRAFLTLKLVLGICWVETDWAKYSFSQTSTIIEVRTPCWPEDSPTTEHSTLATSNHSSKVSRASFRWTTTT